MSVSIILTKKLPSFFPSQQVLLGVFPRLAILPKTVQFLVHTFQTVCSMMAFNQRWSNQSIAWWCPYLAIPYLYCRNESARTRNRWEQIRGRTRKIGKDDASIYYHTTTLERNCCLFRYVYILVREYEWHLQCPAGVHTVVHYGAQQRSVLPLHAGEWRKE